MLLDSLNIDEKDDLEFDEDFKNSGRRNEIPEETRSSSGGSKVGDLQRKAKSNANETCEEKEAKSQVQVCVPEYDVQPQKLYFAAQETYDEKYCYTKLVFSLSILFLSTYLIYIGPLPNVNLNPSRSKEKCVPANIFRSSTMSQPLTLRYILTVMLHLKSSCQVTFERHSEKMGVTNCKHIKDVRFINFKNSSETFSLGLWSHEGGLSD